MPDSVLAGILQDLREIIAEVLEVKVAV